MKKLIKKSVLFLGTVCLCFLGLLNLQQSKEVQAASVVSIDVYSASDLVTACARWDAPISINLKANIDLYEAAVIGENCNITVNGNGYKITQRSAHNTFYIKALGKLTISNTTIDHSLYPDGSVCFWVEEKGNLTVNSGTYIASNSTVADIGVKELHGAMVINGLGMVTINGGTFTGSMADFYAVCLGGQYNYVINGGTFTNNTSGVGVNLYLFYDDPNAKQSLTINGGTFTENRNNGITIGTPDTFDKLQKGATTVTINNGNFYNNGLNGVSVCFANQTCNVKAANIYNNKQAGILAKGSKVNFTSTNANTLKIYNNVKYNVGIFGGAKFDGGNADLSNTTYMDNKGIIVENGATATIGAGTIIKNSLDGIYVNSSSTAVVNGGFISGCTRGIWVYGSTCTINNVEVNGNTTGIDADSACTLTMSAGKIVNNTTGLYVEGTGKATLAGSSAGAIVIAGNSENGIKTAHRAILNASNISVYGGGGYNAQGVGVHMISAGTATISGNIYANSLAGIKVVNGNLTSSANVYSHANRGIIVNTTGTVTVSGTINNNYVGVETLSGTLNSTATYHTNSYGLYMPAGTANVKGGSAKSNTYGVYVGGGTCNISSGSIYSNAEAGVHVGAGTCNLTGGSVYSNKNGLACAGGTTTTSTAIYNNTNSGAYVYGSGVCNVTGGNIYGNDTALWVKGTATISVSKANIYNNGYGLYAHESGTLKVNGSSTDAINIMGNDDVGIHVRDTATASVSNTNIYGGNSYNAQKDGVVVLTSKSVSLGSNTDIYGNTARGVACESGTVSSTASIKSNGTYGVYVKGGTFTMSGGEVTSNKNYGMYLVGTPKVTVSGGNISSNAGAYGEVYDDITDFTLTGTYGGRSSVNGYVYLAKNDNYVKTASSSTLIKIKPSTYYSGRVVINTSSASYATTQERSTLYPNGSWILKKSGVNVVLARIPSIWYDGKEITGTLNLPSADGWYNANTVTSIGKFTAKDEDKDLTSFVMKYEGQVVASGTKDSSGDMHITYDFKHEGIRTYTLTATDSLGNSVTRTVIVKVDLTPPDIVDVDGTELDYGQSGEEPTFKWSVVVVDPDVPFRQRGEDELSGVANISLMPYSDQTEILKRVYDPPHVISATLSDYPDEKGLVIKVVDKAGNAAYKCLLSYDMLDIKVEPFYPR